MRLTKWTKNESGFEEAFLTMNNGQTLMILRKWDRSIEYKGHVSEMKPQGIIRSENGTQVFHTFEHISRKNLIRRMEDYLRLPIKALKESLGVKVPTIGGLFPKRFKEEVSRFLVHQEVVESKETV